MTDTPQILPLEYIVADPKTGKPMIAGTGYSVQFLSGFLKKPDQWTVEKIVENYRLTPAQIHAAWAYYYTHQEEIERTMREEEAEALKHTKPLSTLSGYDEYMRKKRAQELGE